MQDKPEPGPAQYFLFTSDKNSPRSFIGNDMLANLSAAALDAWRAAGGGHPPVVVMYGQGTRQDFDAARLTMEISALSGPNPFTIGGTDQRSFSFEMPEGFKARSEKMGLSYDGRPWRQVEVSYKDGVYTAETTVGGVVYRLFARTKEMLGQMLAALENYFARDLSAESVVLTAEAALRLREYIQSTVDTAYHTNPKLKKEEDGTPGMETEVGSEVTRVKFAHHVQPRGNGLERTYAAVVVQSEKLR